MANMVNLDFTGVEAGTSFVRIPEGDYILKVAKVQQKKSESSGNPYLSFTLKAVKGPAKGLNKSIQHVCSLKKTALWNLRNLLEAAGKTVPSKAIKIDLDKLVNLEVGSSVVDDEFEGKKKSICASFFPVSEFAEGGDGEKKDTEEAEGEAESEAGTEGEEEAEELFE